MPAQEIDLRKDPRYALAGKVVTMNAAREVFKGVVYVDGATIVAVQEAGAPAPAGFQGRPVLRTGGTIYPGLIELHNHLPYDILELWDVPKKYGNREQWRGIPDYRKLISGPLQLIKDVPGYLEAIVRYVECKCLLAGVTASQGITLVNEGSIKSLFSGVVRNVEMFADQALPVAWPSIDDVSTAEKFYQSLVTTYAKRCRIIHLSEGVDERARSHFKALQRPNGGWAITASLAGIHAAGLRDEDWKIFGAHGGAMVWSPLSNLLLYGETADVRAAKAAGVRIGLGSDWSPSGSKNLLGELKVAYLESKRKGGVFTPLELVEMVTIGAAGILRWQDKLGSIEPGKFADLLVVHQSQGNPYMRLLKSDERDVKLVVIGGVPRYGVKRLMQPFGAGSEEFSLAGDPRRLNLDDPAAVAVVGALTLGEARRRLEEGLQALPTPPAVGPVDRELRLGPVWSLALPEEDDLGMMLRPLAPAPEAELVAERGPTYEEIVTPVALDRLTVAEDRARFIGLIEKQRNLPQAIKDGLRALYR